MRRKASISIFEEALRCLAALCFIQNHDRGIYIKKVVFKELMDNKLVSSTQRLCFICQSLDLCNRPLTIYVESIHLDVLIRSVYSN